MDKQYQIKRAARLCHCVMSASKDKDPAHYLVRIGGWTEESLKELEKILYQIADEWYDEPDPVSEQIHALW